MMRIKWSSLLGFLLIVNSSFACICEESIAFSLELADQTPVIADIKYEAKEGMARIIRVYKGTLPDSLAFDLGDCTQMEDGAFYHVYFKKMANNQLSMSDAIRCKRLYQDLKEHTRATETQGTQPEKYNAFYTTIKRTHQELVILRALKDRYHGKIKENLLITNDIKNVDDFTVIKGQMRLGQRVGKWVYYERVGGKWVRRVKRYSPKKN